MPKSYERRISTLEANHQEAMNIINEIKSNHLVHLAQDIKDLTRKVDEISLKIARWGGAILILGVLGQLIIDKLERIIQ